MFYLNGQLCYSPLPPSRYGGPDGYGHGPYCGSDIQLWNLMWLSIPEVDRYLLTGRDKMDAKHIWGTIPNLYTASVVATLGGRGGKTISGDPVTGHPILRDMLKLTVNEFYVNLWQYPYLEKTHVMKNIPLWMDIVEQRLFAPWQWELVNKERDDLFKRLKSGAKG